jgi:hypothetical protein
MAEVGKTVDLFAFLLWRSGGKLSCCEKGGWFCFLVFRHLRVRLCDGVHDGRLKKYPANFLRKAAGTPPDAG